MMATTWNSGLRVKKPHRHAPILPKPLIPTRIFFMLPSPKKVKKFVPYFYREPPPLQSSFQLLKGIDMAYQKAVMDLGE